jgi:NAD(P)-dependent dehydrogenase (short-subunit alcohol dehydrogenase family)
VVGLRGARALRDLQGRRHRPDARARAGARQRGHPGQRDPYDTSATSLGRLGEPADLLGALTFLLSDESAFVTGQTLLVNGGRVFR